MGTKLAPSYANIFMGYLEEQMLEGYHLEPYFWKRFIDDIISLWTHGLKELLEFHDYLNSLHESIKFTMEYSDTQIIFLDTIVKKHPTENRLIVELYTKPTDTHNYLHFSSSHPSHTKRGGPYGRFLRVKRNCTLDEDFEKHSNFLKNKYVERGYPESLVENRIKAKLQNRNELLNPTRNNDSKQNKNQKEQNVVPLVLTYHPSNQQVRDTIMNNWGILQFSERCKKALPEKPLFAT